MKRVRICLIFAKNEWELTSVALNGHSPFKRGCMVIAHWEAVTENGFGQLVVGISPIDHI